MKVAELMTTKLVSVRPLDALEEAVKLLRKRGVRHLLVIEKDFLAGIISDRDVKRALDPGQKRKKMLAVGGLFLLLEPILVEEIMTTEVVTIAPTAEAHEAATIMLQRRFGALPVVENGRVVGIVTETDLLRHFVNQTVGGGKRAATAPTAKPAADPKPVAKKSVKKK